MKPEDFAEIVCRVVLKDIKLPDDLIRLLFLLLVREYERFPDADSATYAHALKYVLKRLPPFGGRLRTPLHALAGLRGEEYHALRDLSYGFNVYRASELKPAERDTDLYSFRKGTFWRDLLSFNLSFDILPKARFEHMHVVGQTGSGKTSLLSQFIVWDIQTTSSVIVLVPKGNMLENLAQLECLDQSRLVYVHPDNPPRLNVFAINPHDESKVNGLVNLINFVFAINDAEATRKQITLVTYCVRLLVHYDSTLMSLRRLLASETLPPEYNTACLSEIGQEFFRTQFSHKKTYGETKEQMLWRIDSLLENPVIQRLFTEKRSEFNMLDAIERGKVVLIDSSIQHTGEMGSQFIGRLFIALVSQAIQQRNTSRNLRPCYFYIDECATYLSENIEGILERSREAKVGLILAHQQLQQLRKASAQLESSVLTNTSIKCVGSCAHDDATTFSREMNVEASVLKNQPQLHFYIKIKGYTHQALPIKVDPTFLSTQPKRQPNKRLESNRPPEPQKEQPKEPPRVPPLFITLVGGQEAEVLPPEKKQDDLDDDIEFFNRS